MSTSSSLSSSPPTPSTIYFTTVVLSMCLILFTQQASDASYVATMKTIRQVKTVFIVFIAFVCCWSPYVVVLLYDSSDSLPLPVHLYTSMLAHLHASLNFAIYGVNNCNFGDNYRHYVEHLAACCCRWRARSNIVAAVLFTSRCTRPNRRTGIVSAVDQVTVECYQLREMEE